MLWSFLRKIVLMSFIFMVNAKSIGGNFNNHDLTKNRAFAVLNKSSEDLFRWQLADGQWNFGYYLGTFHSSIYYLSYLWMGAENIPIDPLKLRQILISEQYPDGSWGDFKDANFNSGNLDATILNYFLLKVLGETTRMAPLLKAKEYILNNGGIEASGFLVKFTLAQFNNFPWESIPKIPDFILEWIDLDAYAQWIPSNFYPVMYIRKMQMTRTKFKIPSGLSKSVGVQPTNEEFNSRFSLKELYKYAVPELAPAHIAKILNAVGSYSDIPEISGAEYGIVKKLLSRQLPQGSWGAYGPATFLTILVLQDFFYHHPQHVVEVNGDHFNIERTQKMVTKGLAFLEAMQKAAAGGNYYGLQSYGNYWDTLLAANSLYDAKSQQLASANPYNELLLNSCKFVLTAQGSSGGVGFGADFQNMPDSDDTAKFILLFAKAGLLDAKAAPVYLRAAQKAVDWLLTMQNSDGGWSGFGKNPSSVSYLDYFVRMGFKLFAPAEFLNDPSSPDVTGHVLEAIAAYRQYDSSRDFNTTILKAVEYLKETQIVDGNKNMWQGKWGVNYIYGTSEALNGLLAVNVSLKAPFVFRSLQWLQSLQNQDGGFGESTASYLDNSLAGKGVSTPTQTSWAAIALLKAQQKVLFSFDALTDKEQENILNRAINYLIDNYEQNGSWSDRCTVGTGHPGFLYMRYEAYSKLFPITALASYIDLTNQLR